MWQSVSPLTITSTPTAGPSAGSDAAMGPAEVGPIMARKGVSSRPVCSMKLGSGSAELVLLKPTCGEVVRGDATQRAGAGAQHDRSGAEANALKSTAVPSQPRFDRATVIDVARIAGVSASTVSNAFRHPDRLAPSTLARVLAAGEGLGYSPNGAARIIRGAGRPRVIGFVADLDDPVGRQAAWEAEQVAADSDLLLEVVLLGSKRGVFEALNLLSSAGVARIVTALLGSIAEAGASAEAVRAVLRADSCPFHPGAALVAVVGPRTVCCIDCV
jgi:hypothetical protein